MQKQEHYRITEALKRRRRLQRDLQIAERYRQGYATTEIARHFDLDRCHVLKIIRELRQAGVIMSAKEKEPWDE
jgi:Mor family transcriptional regulator